MLRKLTHRASLLAACVVSGLITGACATLGADTNAPISELTGTRWLAQSIDGDPVADARQLELAFGAEDRLSGNGGCNGFFGIYEAESGRIDVRGLGRTERACAPPVMAQEEAFIAVLQAAAHYEREADRLLIRDGEGRTLAFRALA